MKEKKPHLLTCFQGMELAELDGAPRMVHRITGTRYFTNEYENTDTFFVQGPTFGAMLISGQKAAYAARASLARQAKEEADKA